MLPSIWRWLDLLFPVAFISIFGPATQRAVNEFDLFTGTFSARMQLLPIFTLGLETICSELQSDWSVRFIFSGSTLLDLQRDFDRQG